MNFNLKISLALIISWIFSPNVIFSDFAKSSTGNFYQKVENKPYGEFVGVKGYDDAILAIKEHEGFRGKIYEDVAGYKTIGYGHVVLPTDTFTTAISERLADKLLREDFDKAVRAAKRTTKLSGYKLIAVAHFIFGNGIGNFNRSILKKKILKGNKVATEFKKWSYYRDTSGTAIQHKNLLKMRKWEAEMYAKK